MNQLTLALEKPSAPPLASMSKSLAETNKYQEGVRATKGYAGPRRIPDRDQWRSTPIDRLIMRALTNAMADDRRSTDVLGPTADEWMQLIRLFSMTKAMP